VTFARENPLAFGSVVGASLLFSGGAIRAASSTSSRAGLAARYAIQPGEEIATSTATRALGATSRGQSLLSRLPGNRLGPEEVGTATAVRVSSGARRRARSVSDLLSGDRSLSPSPRQRELVDRFRPGSRGDTFEAESPGQVSRETDAVAGAESEPLGSPTGDIVDATTGTGQPGPTVTRAETESDTTARGETEADNDTLPLRQDLREAGGVRAFLRGEDVPNRVPRTAESPEIRNLIRGERGQLQLGRGRGRSEQDDPAGPSVRPGEIQSDIQDVTLAQRRLMSGDVESRVDPVGRSTDPTVSRSRVERSEVRQSSDVARGDVEVGELTDEAERSSVRSALEQGQQSDTSDLLDQAQDATVGTETEQRTNTETLPSELTENAVDLGSRTAEVQRPFVRTRVGTNTRIDQRLQTESRTRGRLDAAPELSPEGGFDAGFPTDPGRPGRGDVRRPRPDLDVGSRESTDQQTVGLFDSDSDSEGSRLGTGWLSETFATIATEGRRTTEAPSQEVLEDQPGSALLTGELPTALEVSGDEETQERIEEVESIFSFGTTGGSR